LATFWHGTEQVRLVRPDTAHTDTHLWRRPTLEQHRNVVCLQANIGGLTPIADTPANNPISRNSGDPTGLNDCNRSSAAQYYALRLFPLTAPRIQFIIPASTSLALPFGKHIRCHGVQIPTPIAGGH
jgi:hypothetical protein